MQTKFKKGDKVLYTGSYPSYRGIVFEVIVTKFEYVTVTDGRVIFGRNKSDFTLLLHCSVAVGTKIYMHRDAVAWVPEKTIYVQPGVYVAKEALQEKNEAVIEAANKYHEQKEKEMQTNFHKGDKNAGKEHKDSIAFKVLGQSNCTGYTQTLNQEMQTNSDDTTFNLERALAGDPVETMEGDLVTELHYFKTLSHHYPYPVKGVINGNFHNYTTDGAYLVGEKDRRDLRMKKKVYVAHLVVWSDGSATNYYNEETARKFTINSPGAAYKQIEFTL